jgi:CDP-diacylglycerol--glycerol-3-phosphate 3-phosphatidyltransferase
MKIRIKKENIPNYLCIFRMQLVFVFLVFMFYDFPEYRIAAAVTYLVASATDILDGWLARRYGWVSRTGKILDPLADKLFHMTVLVSFTIKELLPPWLAFPFVLKELVQLTLGYLMIKKRNVVVRSSWYGKLAGAALCLAGLFALMVAENIEKYSLIINTAYAAILVLMLLVMVMYVAKYINVKSEEET